MLTKRYWERVALAAAGCAVVLSGGCGETQFNSTPTDGAGAGAAAAPVYVPGASTAPATGAPAAGTVGGAAGGMAGAAGSAFGTSTGASTGAPSGAIAGNPDIPAGTAGPAPGTTPPQGGAVGNPAGMTGTGTPGAATSSDPTGSATPTGVGTGTDGMATGDPSTGGGEATGDQQPVMEPPQTCPANSTLRPGETTQRIQVGSMTRSFILHVPANYTGQQPVPVVLDWHGILMNSSLQRSFSGFAELSEQEGFIVAFPEGTDTAFNVGICCTSSPSVDDIGFARAIVAMLQEQGCIDMKRIHSVGYSMGGGMTMHLACNAADLFSSVAVAAFDLMPEEDWPCHPSRPIPIILFRSTGDPIVPYDGAVNTIPPNGTPNLVTFIGAKANFAKWADLDGCTGMPGDVGGGCQLYNQCMGGAAVELCTKNGGGHDYMDASAGWAFLKQHPMP